MAKNRKTPDMNLPVWFDGQNINEALFCEEFLHERRIIFANGAFFTPRWSKRLDLFLMADDREVLQDAGKITAEIAKAKAETEFEKYRVIQDRLFMSDFDKYMLELEENAKK